VRRTQRLRLGVLHGNALGLSVPGVARFEDRGRRVRWRAAQGRPRRRPVCGLRPRFARSIWAIWALEHL